MIYFVIAVLVILISIPVIMVIYLKVTEYKPEAIEDSKIIRNNNSSKSKKTYTLTTLNTGYSSLDKNQDFFLEGGKGSRCISKKITLTNLTGITNILKDFDSDFYFLQEVDEPCRRSCYTNQLKYITKKFLHHNSSFVYNYKVKHIPVPILKPMGSVESGMLTLSKYKITESKRHMLKGDLPFLKRLLFLKRCMMINTYKLNDKEKLILINIHLSAYDKGGKIRAQQINHLIEFLTELSKTNKHIIVGGDWNHLLDNSIYKESMPDWVSILPETLFETKFKTVYDDKVNTVRSEDTPYIKDQNFETIIDGFLVSPSVEVVNVKTTDYGFEYTDHNPVTITFKLK